MKIKWLAHASFLITSDSSTRIVTDPYETMPFMKHGEIDETADIVTVSHEHGDHNNISAVKGNPQVLRESAEVKGIKFKAVSTAHDNNGGADRGKNTVFCFDVDGIRVCHAGDLGHLLNGDQVNEIGKVDILMIPVGGGPTIDAKAADDVCNKLGACVIIPMHFKTDKIGIPISGVDDFIKDKSNVTQVDGSEIELKAGDIPTGPQIMVLKPSL